MNTTRSRSASTTSTRRTSQGPTLIRQPRTRSTSSTCCAYLLIFLGALLKMAQIGLGISCLSWGRNNERDQPEQFFLLVAFTSIFCSFVLLIITLVSPSSFKESSSFKDFLLAEIFYHGLCTLLFASSSIIYTNLIEFLTTLGKANQNLDNKQLAGMCGLVNAGLYGISVLIAFIHWRRQVKMFEVHFPSETSRLAMTM